MADDKFKFTKEEISEIEKNLGFIVFDWAKHLIVHIISQARGKGVDVVYMNTPESLSAGAPPDALAIVLENIENYTVSSYAAKNPSAPPDALRALAGNKEHESLLRYIAENPNCPTDVLRNILEGGDTIASKYAVKNLNTPPDAKIKWMRDTGRIGKENPEEHVIEYDGKEEKDEDLEKLKSLVS